jgi:uncharacterized membrane protein
LPRRAALPQPLVALLLLTTLTLGLGFLLKDECNNGWDGRHFTAMCYNDIMPLYGAHGFDDDLFPYVSHPERDAERAKVGTLGYDPDDPTTHWGFVEYPVLTGLHMWMAAKIGTHWTAAFGGEESPQFFFYVNAAMLAAFALGTTWLLYRLCPDRRRVALFAAGTPLLFYGFHNWDLMPVFFVVLSIYWFEARRFVASGVALSLGVSAKLFPIVVAPLLFLILVRRAWERHRASRGTRAAARAAATDPQAWRLVAGGVGGFLAVNLPFLFWGSRELYLEVFRFHERRTPNFETPWWMLQRHLEDAGHAAGSFFGDRDRLDQVLLFVFVLAYAGLLVATWVNRWGAREAAFGALLAFLLLNKVFSVQYALWILPFFALIALPTWSYAVYAAADAWVYTTLFPWFTDFSEGDLGWVSAAVFARWASLVLLLALLLLGIRSTRRAPVGLRAPSALAAGAPGRS